jgi:hypothetical protein
MAAPFLSRTFNMLIIFAVMGVAGLGFYYAGTPLEERYQKLDAERVADLQAISDAVKSSYVLHAALPTTLAEALEGNVGLEGQLQDPKTGQPYHYRVTGPRTFELCATFDAEMLPENSHAAYYPVDRFWEHPKGDTCFVFSAR